MFSFSNNLSAQWLSTSGSQYVGDLKHLHGLMLGIDGTPARNLHVHQEMNSGLIMNIIRSGVHFSTEISGIVINQGFDISYNTGTFPYSTYKDNYVDFNLSKSGQYNFIINNNTNFKIDTNYLSLGQLGITGKTISNWPLRLTYNANTNNGAILKSTNINGDLDWYYLQDEDSTNEIQTLNISNDTIFLTSGGYAVVPDKSDTNELQHLKITGNILSLSNDCTATTVDLSSFSTTIWHEGTNKIYYNNGRVGIGTANPNYNLHMHGVQTSASKTAGNGTTSAANANYHQITNPATGATATDGLLIGNFVTRAIINQQENDNLDIYTNAKKRLTITNSGKVGIGIETPQASLHVHTITPPSNPNPGGNGNNGNNGSGIGFASKGITQEHNYSVIQITNNNTGTQQADGLQLGLVNNAAFLKQQENAPLDFYTNNKKRLRITNTGNVGIGTSTSDRKLVVSSDNSSVQLKIQRTGSSAGETEIGTDNKGFYIYTGGYSNNKPFFINTNGEVGIGTNNPSAKLEIYTNTGNYSYSMVTNVQNTHVKNYVVKLNGNETFRVYGNGMVEATDVWVSDYSNFPDYVFNNNYNLMSLNTLSKYIKDNKHLPEIPSAKKVENEGVSLKEMNSLLLKKVEELTLYIIDLQNQINQINK